MSKKEKLSYFDFWFDRQNKILFVYKPITVKEFLILKKKYGKVEVVGKKLRW